MHQVQIFEDLLFQSSRYWRCSRRIERWRQRQSQYCWDQQKSVRILLYVSSDLSDDQNNLLWRQCKHVKEVWIKQTFLTTLASHCHWSTPSYRWPSPPSRPCLPPSTSPSPSFAGVLAPPCLCRLLCPVKKRWPHGLIMGLGWKQSSHTIDSVQPFGKTVLWGFPRWPLFLHEILLSGRFVT